MFYFNSSAIFVSWGIWIRGLFISLLFFSGNICFSQSVDKVIHIQHMLVDEDTQAPIPYANIAVVNTRIGTSSDDNGIFTLLLPGRLAGGNIKISCIGYATKIVTINSIMRDSLMKISLKEEDIILQDIPIFSEELNGYQIISRAFNKANSNFTGDSYALNQYYHGYASDSSGNKYYDVDAVIREASYIEANGYSVGTQILHKRNNIGLGSDPIEKFYYSRFMWQFRDYKQFANCDIADAACQKIVKVESRDYSIYDGRLCYLVVYSTNSASNKSKGLPQMNRNVSEGKLYIDVSEYGILRWEISKLDLAKKDTIKVKYNPRKPTKNLVPLKSKFVRNYKIVDGIYYPSLIQLVSDELLILPGNKVKTLQITHSNYTVDIELLGTMDWETDAANHPGNHLLDFSKTTYKEDFWRSFSYGFNSNK